MDPKVKISAQNINFFYGKTKALKNISLDIYEKQVTAFIGPSGCGKSTFIRLLNRMNDLIPGSRVDGRIMMDGFDINNPKTDVVDLRRRVGMVFQKPNPFPKTIFENMAYGLSIGGIRDKNFIEQRVVTSLKRAALFEDVKDRLNDSALMLSGGQQQRLCIARALAMHPEILLLDEPTSALDPKATAHIEELVVELKNTVTIIQVTHNIPQAARISDFTAFIYLGSLVEFGPTEKLFTVPQDKRTEQYLTGKFG